MTFSTRFRLQFWTTLFLGFAFTPLFAGDVNPDFLEGRVDQRKRYADFAGSDFPADFALKNWQNAEAMTAEDLKGKVVVLDFWATWCGPCIASIPKNNALQKKFADKNVVVLGVCHPRGGEKMADMVKNKKMTYPTGLDQSGAIIKHFKVNGFPDYHIIGRDGKVWAADVSNGSVEAALEQYLNIERRTSKIEVLNPFSYSGAVSGG